MRIVLSSQVRGMDLVWRALPSMGLAECVNGAPLDLIVVDPGMPRTRICPSRSGHCKVFRRLPRGRGARR